MLVYKSSFPKPTPGVSAGGVRAALVWMPSVAAPYGIPEVDQRSFLMRKI